jgi:hypothetical protein
MDARTFRVGNNGLRFEYSAWRGGGVLKAFLLLLYRGEPHRYFVTPTKNKHLSCSAVARMKIKFKRCAFSA